MYQLEYLPIAKRDMDDIARYIAYELHNLIAAKNLVKELIEATEDLITFPYIRPVYMTPRIFKYEYRKLLVKNYIIFYWVNEQKKKIMIARVIYAKRDLEKTTMN